MKHALRTQFSNKLTGTISSEGLVDVLTLLVSPFTGGQGEKPGLKGSKTTVTIGVASTELRNLLLGELAKDGADLESNQPFQELFCTKIEQLFVFY